MTRTTSPAGRAAIMQREGVRLTAYKDSVGIWTIGCGHSSVAPTPPFVREGMTITREQAETILSADLAVFERAVSAADLKGRLSHNAFDAAVSLALNIGVGAFTRSTVARKIAEGDMAGAADAILLWNKPAVLEGRRKAERAQFLTPDGTPALDSIMHAIADHAAEAEVAPRPVAVSASVPTAGPRHADNAKAPPLTGWRAVLASVRAHFGQAT